MKELFHFINRIKVIFPRRNLMKFLNLLKNKLNNTINLIIVIKINMKDINLNIDKIKEAIKNINIE